MTGACRRCGALVFALLLFLVAVPATHAAALESAEREITVRLVLPRTSEPPQNLLLRLQGVAYSPFGQNVTLLLLTAAITGLAVPKVKARMDLRYFEEQKGHEARLSRQANLITEQTEFLKSYVAALWKIHFTILPISYAKVCGMPEADFKKIWDAYGDLSWAALHDCRRIISSAIHLVPASTHEEMLRFYSDLVEEDTTLTNMVEEMKPSAEEWDHKHGYWFENFAKDIDDHIAVVASALRLSAR